MDRKLRALERRVRADDQTALSELNHELRRRCGPGWHVHPLYHLLEAAVLRSLALPASAHRIYANLPTVYWTSKDTPEDTVRRLARTALAFAKAQDQAHAEGFEFEWDRDSYPFDHDYDEVVYALRMRDPGGRIVESTSGILERDYLDRPWLYEAELAYQHLGDDDGDD